MNERDDERVLDDQAWEAELKRAAFELRRQAYREQQQRSARRVNPWVM